MKTKRLQKMQLKKATISKMNQNILEQLKGGTRSSETTQIDDSALISHCIAIQCY